MVICMVRYARFYCGQKGSISVKVHHAYRNQHFSFQKKRQAGTGRHIIYTCVYKRIYLNMHAYSQQTDDMDFLKTL